MFIGGSRPYVSMFSSVNPKSQITPCSESEFVRVDVFSVRKKNETCESTNRQLMPNSLPVILVKL